MAKLQGNTINIQGIVSEDGTTLLGFSDPSTTGDGVDFPLSGGGSSSGGGLPTLVSFSPTLTLNENKYSPQTTITGAISFASSGTPVAGATYFVRLVANGTNQPTFASNFKELESSTGFVNVANVVNLLQVMYDGSEYVYIWTQRMNDTGASDVTSPTLSSAVVQNATPTIVAVTYSEALDQTSTLNIADWLVTGHTVSAVAYASSTVINLTVDAFIYGDTARTVTYTNNANRVKDLAGNAAATSSPVTITNNVAAVPSQVTGLTLGSATTSTQALTWTAPASNGSSITDYVVQYSLDNISWTTFADGTSTTTSTSVTGLSTNTLYYYRVAAVNAVGTGSYSTAVSGTTAAGATAPAQVTGLTLGTPTDTTQPLTWSAPSNGGSAITDYLIEYKASSSGTWLTFSDGTSTTAATTVTGLTASTSYDYRVSAINAIGTGTASSTVTGSTTSASATPMALLHFESSTFTDSSPSARTVTKVGTPTVTTSFSGFGNCFTNGGTYNGYLTIDGTDFSFNGQDFTLECWVNTANNSQNQGLIVKGSGTSGISATATDFSLRVDTSGKARLSISDGSSAVFPVSIVSTTTVANFGTWYHLAAVKNGNVFTLYVNGVAEATVTTSFTIPTTSKNVIFGSTCDAANSLHTLQWQMEEAAIWNMAKYTANFTPPTAPY